MSAKAAMSGGLEPGSPGSPGVGREGTAPAGVRASGRAALLAAAYLQHPEGCRTGCFLGSARAELLPKVAETGFKELQHPCPRAGLFSQAHACQEKSWAASPLAQPAALPRCPLRPPGLEAAPAPGPCCICPPRGAREEQKAGVSPRHKDTKQAPSWAEMDRFASVERSTHASVPGSLWLAAIAPSCRSPECHPASPVAPSQISASWSHGKV